MGLCHAQVKLATHTVGFDVGRTSNHRRRTLHRPIPYSMMPNAAYPKSNGITYTFSPARAF